MTTEQDHFTMPMAITALQTILHPNVMLLHQLLDVYFSSLAQGIIGPKVWLHSFPRCERPGPRQSGCGGTYVRQSSNTPKRLKRCFKACKGSDPGCEDRDHPAAGSLPPFRAVSVLYTKQ